MEEIVQNLEHDMPSFDAIDVLDLLPQQPPFVMIDKLLYYDEKKTVCGFFVKEENLFCNNGVLVAEGMMENIAQTCAARLGFINKYILKKGIQLGFIGAIRNFVVNREPNIGDTLITTVVVEESIMGMTLANATVEVNGETIVTSQIKIALAEEKNSNVLEESK